MTGEEGQKPYVSTTCLRGVDYRQTIRSYNAAGIDRIELGYCPDQTVDLGEVLETETFDAVAHNYFRPVEDEFVINLASQDSDIRHRSIEYIRDGIDFCAHHGLGFYTFHAGFRTDPDASFRFDAETVPDSEVSLDTFVESLRPLLSHAAERGVEIAVENNVVEDQHVIDGDPVVLLARPDEFNELLERLEVNILFDTGHAKVAAETLGFDREHLLKTVKPALTALHIHTNDGTEDSHDPVERTDWAYDIWTRHDVPTTIETYVDDVSVIEDQLRLFDH